MKSELFHVCIDLCDDFQPIVMWCTHSYSQFLCSLAPIYLYTFCIVYVFYPQKFYALGLEINERPLKRPLLDFENLSISETLHKGLIISKPVLVFFFFSLHHKSIFPELFVISHGSNACFTFVIISCTVSTT